MANDPFDRDSWEQRWAQALGEHSDKVASRPPNTHPLTETANLQPGLAFDAGCGHGAEAMWLAASGWRVTAVDFSVTALEHARSTAQAIGADVAERIQWVEGDLGNWTPPLRCFDLVSCLFVHVGWIGGRDGDSPRYRRRARGTLSWSATLLWTPRTASQRQLRDRRR
ncbi:MAG: class I SAM-dependent methyltransferase [Nocardioidaceae bacterium]